MLCAISGAKIAANLVKSGSKALPIFWIVKHAEQFITNFFRVCLRLQKFLYQGPTCDDINQADIRNSDQLLHD